MRSDFGPPWPTHKRRARERRRQGPPGPTTTRTRAATPNEAARDLVDRGLADPMILGQIPQQRNTNIKEQT